MHRCLQVIDIVSNILEFVSLIPPDQDNPWRGYTNRHTTNPVLAALARTCRTLSEPSLDVLWRNQYTLGPLIRTLPSRLYVEDIEDGSGGDPEFASCVRRHLTLSPPTAPSDWVRFEYYASKIKSLGYYMFEFPDQDLMNWHRHHLLHCRRPVKPQTMELLCLCRRQTVMLPNLRRLRLTRHDIPLFRFVPMLLNPNLQVLNIAFYAETIIRDPMLSNDLYYAALPELLESLPALCPSLTELAMCTEQFPEVALHALSFAKTCPHLVACFVASIPTWSPSADILLHLAQQPHLRDVFLSLDEETADLSWLQPVSLRYPFPSLDTLDMRSPTLSSCATLINLMGPCALRLVRLQPIEGPPPASDFRDVFVALRTHCSVRTLQSIVVEYYPEAPGCTTTSEEHSLTGDIVSILYPFSQLRFLQLQTPFHCFMVDQDIKDMADHWPLLIELRIADQFSWCTIPFETTWAGLAYLAWKCPQLIEVALAIDMTVDNVAETTCQAGFRQNMHLRLINCLDSTMCEVEQCARSVHAFAPLVWEIWGNGLGEWQDDDSSRLPQEQDAIGYYETASKMIREAHASEEFILTPKYDILEDLNPWSTANTRPSKATWTRVHE
ncbi:hypothetical protein L226DRAFT_561915 [Lentinus tigrinus ALCF2SS1-7]|uniref:F-box domain-containing protein n=1 Tax=Lentinus tigrinus ALCF2SS1-6 TaxID=1328759 RepID=A0A5C2S548_9APHY|nr:hypothetical protein L227DRAFT_602159 [Lentinus tigrinus ALCF2SS1-6]RPD72216.1 hypothetical protein L226DRAFT_561915 [Lentinus tigrinus ALCF2SS1-7]